MSYGMTAGTGPRKEIQMAQTATTKITARRNAADSKAFGSPVWDIYENGQLVETTTGHRNEREAVRAYLGSKGLAR